MAMVRWEPFRDLLTIQDRMNRMFDDAFRSTRRSDEDEWALGGTWAPPVDIYERDGSLVLSAELPGIDPKKVDIRLENNVLTLKGERALDGEVDRESFHRLERAYGGFTRSFTLPTAVDQDKIQADYKDGVLKVTLPTREEAKPRQIPISVGK